MDFPIVISEAAGPVTLHAPGATAQTLAAPGRWPTWNPAADSLAISIVGRDGPGHAHLDTITLEGAHRGVLHAPTEPVPAFIAPGVPHYAHWSPNGHFVTYVAPTAAGLGFFLSRADTGFTMRQLATGAPIFPEWTRDSSQVVCHAASGMRCFDTEGRAVPTLDAREAAGFRAPVVTGDGRWLVYAEAAAPDVILFGLESGAAGPTEVVRFHGGIAMEARPGHAAAVSVAVAKPPDSSVFTELHLVDLREPGAHPQRLWRGPFVAAWWSPTGEQLAMVSPTHSGDGRYAVQVLDATGRVVAATEPLLPSSDFRTYLSFFDQYAKSHHLWSPDGSDLLLAGRLGGDAISAAFGDARDYVYRWRVAASSPMELLAPGLFGIFPPSSGRWRPAGASGSVNDG